MLDRPISFSSYQLRIIVVLSRLYVLLLGICAIGASILLLFSCQMFSYEISEEFKEGLAPPFDQLSSASIGLFSYSELTTTEEDAIFGDKCIQYNDWENEGQNVYFSVARIAAIVAPVLGFLAWIQVFFDMICCRLCGSFILISLLFFTASAIQGCTFLVFADSEFW